MLKTTTGIGHAQHQKTATGHLSTAFSFVLLLALCTVAAAGGTGVGTAFTYQGELLNDGALADGPFDLLFRLYDDPDFVAGVQMGPDVFVDDLLVTGGLFKVEPDFGAGVFDGAQLWLEVSVREGGSTGPYIPMNPRQSISSTPYSLLSQESVFAETAGDADTLNGLSAGEIDTNTTYSAGVGLGLMGTTMFIEDDIVARKDSGAEDQNFDSGTLYLDFTNNRVGVGTSSPARSLDVSGQMEAGAYFTGSDQFDDLNLPAAEFRATTENQDYTMHQEGYWFSGGSNVIQAVAPVNLPDLATITSFRCYHYDNGASDYTFDFRMYSRGFSDTTVSLESQLAGTTSGTSSVMQTAQDTGLAVFVNNESVFRHLWIQMLRVGGGSLGSSARFYGCEIGYRWNILTN